MVRSPHDFPPDFLWPPAPARGPRCRVMGYVPSAMAAPSAGLLCKETVFRGAGGKHRGVWVEISRQTVSQVSWPRQQGHAPTEENRGTMGRDWLRDEAWATLAGFRSGQGPGACPFSEARTPHMISELRLRQNRGPAAVAGQAVAGILTSVTFTTPICGLNRSILKVCSQ